MVTALRGIAAGAALAVALLGFMPATRPAHPLHTSLTEISHNGASGTLTVRVRAFAQDIDSVLGKGARKTAIADSAVMQYVNRRIALSDQRGRPIVLSACGIRREGEALFACIQARSAGATGTLTMRNELLFDLFDDQINVVQVISGTSRRSLLFTKMSGAKRLF